MNRAPDDDDARRSTLGPSPNASTRTGRAASDAPNSSMFGHTLVEGTLLGEFEITGLIGEGGFGIVYLAYDGSLMRDVAIKEYMPSSLATRGHATDSVVVKAERHTETFRAGLKSFVNEARLLARFDHPALLKVYRFWEANGTAYMAMPYYKGPTLKDTLAAMAQPPDQALLMAWLRPLLDAVAVLHGANCFHRDIAPDNILLTPTGPLLLDFGAARRVIGDMTHALTVVLKPGYAPIEQYGDVATMAQGAWTDLYALASVVYGAVTGRPPVSSVERLMSDSMPPLSRVAAGRYSECFLRAIDAALAVRPQDRTQSVAQFWDQLDADDPKHAPLPALLAQAAVDGERAAQTQGPRPPTALLAPQMDIRFTQVPLRTELRHKAGATAASTAAAATTTRATRTVLPAAPAVTTARTSTPTPTPTPTPSHTQTRRPLPQAATPPAAQAAPAAAAPSRTPWYAAGALAALLALGAAALLFKTRQAASPEPAASAAVPAALPASRPVPLVPAPVPTPAPAPAPATSTAPPALPKPPPTVVKPPASVPAAAAPAAPAKPPKAAPAKIDKPLRAAPRLPAAEPAPARPPAANAATRARCSDILTKGSLEPLSADETAFLKRECR